MTKMKKKIQRFAFENKGIADAFIVWLQRHINDADYGHPVYIDAFPSSNIGEWIVEFSSDSDLAKGVAIGIAFMSLVREVRHCSSKAYKVVMCNCDGGKIGKIWAEWQFFDKNKAEGKLQELINEHNSKELARTDSFCIKERERAQEENKHWWRLYKPDVVEGIEGWCVWAYTCMLYLQETHIS